MDERDVPAQIAGLRQNSDRVDPWDIDTAGSDEVAVVADIVDISARPEDRRAKTVDM